LRQFRVIDLRSPVIEPEHLVEASTPEGAAEKALGEKCVRGGPRGARLMCRVYWTDITGSTNMVRLYRTAEPAGPLPKP
jgi:hypothetical protein